MAQQQALWHLENIDVTAIFCPTKLGGMDPAHSEKHFKRHTYIYLPEEDADKIYFIYEGRIKIGSYSEDGKEITKAILGKGEVFGELVMVGEYKRRDFALTMEDTTVCVVPCEEIAELMRDYNPLALFMMRILGNRALIMEKRLEALVFKDSRTRIVEFLRDLAERKGERVGFETVVRQFLTHQDIANMTATSRQTVTTLLNELRQAGVLTFNRRRLLIRDLDRLR